MQAFISYKREDQTFAEQLRDTLQNWGYKTWIDIENIPKGSYWPDEIDKGLGASEIVIGVISPESLQSRNVKNEWDWAIENKKRLLLILLHPCSIPHRYISINYIDFTKNSADGFSALKTALARPTTSDRSDTPSITKPPNRNRERMLQKVHTFWVEGVLEKSLHGAALLELGIEEKPAAIDSPWDMILQHRVYGDYTLKSTTQIVKVFHDLDNTMLILGEPGSGKTTTLLELARDLIKQALQDSSRPIPVILNLSSWATQHKPLDEWVVDELNTKYQVPRRVARDWVENDQLALLLDGLDEVQQHYRNTCVEAINEFRHEHGFVDLAVCSRIQDYDALSSKLQLHGAIVLQPLRLEQIDTYLTNLGSELDDLREKIHQYEWLQELAHEPLMLSIMILAHRNLPQGLSFPISLGETHITEYRKKLFDTYVQRMFERRGNTQYSPEQTIYWLTWLAQKMNTFAQTVFYIERIQPTWLESETQSNWTFRLTQTTIGMAYGLGYGIVFGLLVALALGWGQGALIGVVILAAFSLASGPTVQREEIRVDESLRLSWRRSDTMIGLLIGGIAGVSGLIVGFVVNLPIAGAVVGITAGLVGPLAAGISSAEKLETRSSPNQGVRRAFWNAIRTGALVAGIIGGVSMVVVSVFMGLATGLVAGVVFGIGFGLFFSLSFGIRVVIRHLVLRVILSLNGYIPLNYAQFLDYAAERVFLRKVGGGYIFIHRLLLEYFAER